jgi:hypothetical protein
VPAAGRHGDLDMEAYVTEPVVIADGGYAAGEWVGTAAVILLIFVIAAAVVAVAVWLFQGGQESLAVTLLNPAVPITAVVMTVCCELIIHR